MTRARALVAALAAMVLVAGCSSDGSGPADASGGTSTETTETSTEASTDSPAPEQFGGSVEDFYVVPDPLPPGEPGDLIRTMPVETDPGVVGLRIMYHSTDAEDEDRAVTGLVSYPEGEAPDDGWPVLAWAHGTSGLAAPCAPSRGGSFGPAYGVEGVQVATDYIGLGPEGELHPYLSKEAEANAVIDAVAAAQTLPDAHAGDRWAVVGVSQGGHAALVTNEAAAERLPEAELVGAVALAPGAQLGEDYGDAVQIKIITTLVLFGVAAEDPEVDPADYLNPEALAAAEVIETGCVADVIEAMPAVAAEDDYFTTDPREDTVGEEWVAHNDPGQVVSPTPLMLVQGGQDILVVPARTASLLERLCGIGQVVDMVEVPTADHDTVVAQSEDQVTEWLAARFAGDPATDDC